MDLLLAVFDGHGGHDLSIFCKILFPTILEWNIEFFKGEKDDYIEKSLKKSV